MTKRFDESVFPTVDEVRERCLRDPDEEMGQCGNVYHCIVANLLMERTNSEAQEIVVSPSTMFPDNGEARIRWGEIEADWGVYPNEVILTLPRELNRLAIEFDALDEFGTTDSAVQAREVVPICDRIIAERKVAT